MGFNKKYYWKSNQESIEIFSRVSAYSDILFISMKKTIPIVVVLLVGVTVGIFLLNQNKTSHPIQSIIPQIPLKNVIATPLDSLKIEEMRKRQYPGSDVVIEQTL